jgi:hypothetical protein
MGHHPSHHRWSTHEIDERYLMSVCDVCELEVKHPRGRLVTKRHAGRWIGNSELSLMEDLPTCGGVERQVYHPRHRWERISDAPPSPRGMPCHLVYCVRCHIRAEGLASFGVTVPRVTKAWRRWRRYDHEEWSRDDMPHCAPYQSDEINDRIRELYGTMSERQVADAIGSKQGFVRSRLRIMGLTSKDKATRQNMHWTQAEDIVLASNIDEKPMAALMKLLRRSRDAIILRAHRNGLLDGFVPRGWTTIQGAVKRFGYCDRTIVEWRKRFRWKPQYAFVPGLSLRDRGANRPSIRIYRISDVERAVKWHNETEYYWPGALRRDVPKIAMMQLLARHGVQRPPNRPTWRITSEILDACAAQYHSLISIAEYARTKCIDERAMMRRVKMAGYHRGEFGFGWKMPIDDLDKVLETYPLMKSKKRKTK